MCAVLFVFAWEAGANAHYREARSGFEDKAERRFFRGKFPTGVSFFFFFPFFKGGHLAARVLFSYPACFLLKRGTSRVATCAQASSETLTKVQEIIADQLGTDQGKVAAGAKMADLGADSLDTVEIMMALEEEFDITLDEEGAEQISTVQEGETSIQRASVGEPELD